MFATVDADFKYSLYIYLCVQYLFAISFLVVSLRQQGTTENMLLEQLMIIITSARARYIIFLAMIKLL